MPVMTTLRALPGAAKLLLARPLIALVAAGAIAAGLFLTAERQHVPVTDREQRVAMSDREQQQVGGQQYRKTLRKRATDIVSSGPAYDMVRRVTRRITAVARADKPRFDWKVTLLRSRERNAYCLPGGKIVVYTGILPLARDDAGLATVLGHEVAHATAEHAAERIQQRRMTGTVVNVLAGGVAFTPGQYAKVAALLGAGAEVGATLPWSRQQESEADHIGLVYMARAGYPPRAAIGFSDRMEQAARKQGRPPEHLSTHPSGENRAAAIREWLPEAERARARAAAG